MPGRVRHAPNRPGAHYLTDRAVANSLVRSSGSGPGDLVLDLGAGAGALTGPLARTGATVVAVERDPDLAAALRRRFGSGPRVVDGDLREVPLPRRPYLVVANLPFSVTTATLRRLLDPPDTRLRGADLLVEWGYARRASEPAPRDARGRWWSGRFELTLVRRVPARSFRPEPRVDAAHLRVRPRSIVASARAQRMLRMLLTAGGDQRSVAAVLRTVVPARALRPVAARSGLDLGVRPDTLTGEQWCRLAEAVACR